ncbi:Aerobic respiration control sensor protein ArcB [Raoultella terrigena]|uniref:Aerobic respiration control sensor protein ArcB n=1 Tax=Raoultella terrigena TaxID=577 RepID=A0A4U9D883_RAOTE|nr:Aerobic respiration control sensor protein ArcB [Raoultella terrigena]
MPGMDDVLSKPLSVPALTAIIKKFWDSPEDDQDEAPAVDAAKSASVLDIPMLEQYIELVGPKLISDGLAVSRR